MHSNRQPQKADRTPAAASSARSIPAGLLALQAGAGNAAVVQMLRQAGHAWAQPEQHQHNAGCGHQQAEQPAVQRSAVQDVLRTGGRPLDGATRSDMEARLGADFSDVRIHDDGAARASAAEVGARAYTSGSHIVVGKGGGDMHTLAHELTHVIQQRQGPVAGTDNGAGLRVSDPSDRFEREAEATAQRVMAQPSTVQRRADGQAPAPLPAPASPASPTQAVVQRWMQQDYVGTMQGDDAVFQPDGGRAGSVRVTRLRGTPLADAANSPSNAGNPIGWQTLLGQGLQLGGQMPPQAHYNAVRMHLWNGRLGGPGNNPLNLAPGPAPVNSQMSAQAETPVKNLVEYGYEVDLTTTVAYQNGPGNPLDLSTVVPNHISMAWEGRKPHSPTVNGTWSSHIPLPVPAINAATQQQYQTLQDSPQTRLLLLNDLAARSNQFRGEVLTLLQPVGLKRTVMEAYPDLYALQTPQDKGMFLSLLPGADRHAFLNTVLAGNDQGWLQHCFGPLIAVGQHAAVQAAFQSKPAAQRAWIMTCPTTDRHLFLASLGVLADAIALADPLVYSYYLPADQARLADLMNQQGTIDTFLAVLSGPDRFAMLDQWARLRGPHDPVAYITGLAHLDQAYKDAYHQRVTELATAALARERRPTRSASRINGF
ncbi:eCIS core domain-containing protein [Streptomyces gardneri]|uniref:eCIS core domain-containing protein n=1 Tax=Streptomyces gardneri TaxID=66892 RepID=UPI0035D90469